MRLFVKRASTNIAAGTNCSDSIHMPADLYNMNCITTPHTKNNNVSLIRALGSFILKARKMVGNSFM